MAVSEIADRLLPRTASNDYRGSKVALYTFVLVTLLMMGRSLIHFLKQDGGVNSIAGIVVFPGDPDPNQVIYLFSSLWGSQQVITAAIYAIVIVRYRSLVPLMWTLFLVEVVFRLTAGAIHPLAEEARLHTPPGAPGTFVMGAVGAVMLALSLRESRAREDAPAAADLDTAIR